MGPSGLSSASDWSDWILPPVQGVGGEYMSRMSPARQESLTINLVQHHDFSIAPASEVQTLRDLHANFPEIYFTQ